MLKKIVGSVALGGVAVFGIGAVDNTTRDDSGSIVEAGELGAFVTQVGDCFFDLPQNEVGITTVQGVPCSEAHHWQVVHKENISLDEFDAGSVTTLADNLCNRAVENIANSISYEKALEYEDASLSGLYPTEQSWLKDDRTVDCLLGNDVITYYSSILD